MRRSYRILFMALAPVSIQMICQICNPWDAGSIARSNNVSFGRGFGVGFGVGFGWDFGLDCGLWDSVAQCLRRNCYGLGHPPRGFSPGGLCQGLPLKARLSTALEGVLPPNTSPRGRRLAQRTMFRDRASLKGGSMSRSRGRGSLGCWALVGSGGGLGGRTMS